MIVDVFRAVVWLCWMRADEREMVRVVIVVVVITDNVPYVVAGLLLGFRCLI